MYQPVHYVQADRAVIDQLIARHPFATLIAHTSSTIEVNHLPLLQVAAQVARRAVRDEMRFIEGSLVVRWTRLPVPCAAGPNSGITGFPASRLGVLPNGPDHRHFEHLALRRQEAAEGRLGMGQGLA